MIPNESDVHAPGPPNPVRCIIPNPKHNIEAKVK
jgi:hypothetical protein